MVITADKHTSEIQTSRVYPVISRDVWITALVFMLSLSLTGLTFYPAILVSIAMLLKAYRNNAYECIVMSLLLFGGYGLMSNARLPIKMTDICLIVSIVLFFVFIKPPIVKKTIILLTVYAVLSFALALYSAERLSIQFLMWRPYMSFVFFIIPIVVFSRRPFNMMEFWNSLMPYVLLACIFYILDAYVLKGNVLMPGTANQWIPTFYKPLMDPTSMVPVRKYPPGLYPMFLLIYPVARYFRLRRWQWCVVILALISSQTFSIMFAVFVTYIFFRFGLKRLFQIILIAIITGVAAYGIDSMLPMRKTESVNSYLRIKSSIDQFFILFDAADEEELAQFGSGRMAQVLPRIEMVEEEDRQWTGLGYLHPEKNTVKRYEIVNEYYTDISENEEVVAVVEVVPVQIYISGGWIGMILHCLLFLFLYLFIRKLKGNIYFLSLLFCCVITGIGGFCGLIHPDGLYLAAMAFSTIILSNRNVLPGFPAIEPLTK